MSRASTVIQAYRIWTGVGVAVGRLIGGRFFFGVGVSFGPGRDGVGFGVGRGVGFGVGGGVAWTIGVGAGFGVGTGVVDGG